MLVWQKKGTSFSRQKSNHCLTNCFFRVKNSHLSLVFVRVQIRKGAESNTTIPVNFYRLKNRRRKKSKSLLVWWEVCRSQRCKDETLQRTSRILISGGKPSHHHHFTIIIISSSSLTNMKNVKARAASRKCGQFLCSNIRLLLHK